jgi:hypothetical protein
LNFVLKALKQTDSHPYLGVILSSDLRFNKHCDHVSSKASKTLNFISRNFYHSTRKVKTQLYLSLVRPLLEYACSAWDPYTQRNIKQLEKVQRRAARFIYRDYSRESSVSSMIDDLNLPLLSTRRECLRLGVFYKASLGLNVIKLDQFTNFSSSRTRRKHTLKLDHLSARTEVFKYSFFPVLFPSGIAFPNI